jgi:hypothetical protein
MSEPPIVAENAMDALVAWVERMPTGRSFAIEFGHWCNEPEPWICVLKFHSRRAPGRLGQVIDGREAAASTMDEAVSRALRLFGAEWRRAENE